MGIAFFLLSFYNVKMTVMLFNTSNSGIETYINNIYSDINSSNKEGCFEIISATDTKYLSEYLLQCIKRDIEEHQELEQILPNYDHWCGLARGYNYVFEKAEIKTIDNIYPFGLIFLDDSFFHRAYVYVLITNHDVNNPSRKNYVQTRLGLDYENFEWKISSILLKNLPNGRDYHLSTQFAGELGCFDIK